MSNDPLQLSSQILADQEFVWPLRTVLDHSATQVIYILMIQRAKFGNGDMSDIHKEFQRIVAENYRLTQ